MTNNLGVHRYEVRYDGELAGFAAYDLSGDNVIFTHTEIGQGFGGKGLGGRLVKAALDDVRARHRMVTPLCPFVAGYIRGHAAYADLVRSRRGGTSP